jgi:hypothetical protein
MPTREVVERAIAQSEEPTLFAGRLITAPAQHVVERLAASPRFYAELSPDLAGGGDPRQPSSRSNLFTYGEWYDVGVRDLGLLGGALVLGRLASVYDPPLRFRPR